MQNIIVWILGLICWHFRRTSWNLNSYKTGILLWFSSTNILALIQLCCQRGTFDPNYFHVGAKIPTCTAVAQQQHAQWSLSGRTATRHCLLGWLNWNSKSKVKTKIWKDLLSKVPLVFVCESGRTTVAQQSHNQRWPAV